MSGIDNINSSLYFNAAALASKNVSQKEVNNIPGLFFWTTKVIPANKIFT